MEMMHPSSKADDASALYEAAMTGNTSTLHRLIQRDSLILRRSRLSCYSETPLHISVLAGHVDFSREILRQDPEMAAEVDTSNFTPLHLAAALGHTEIVRILLCSVGAADACLVVRDEDGRMAIHLAVIRGRVGILRELVIARPESVLEKLDGDTVLHLCVKYNHLEALKLLVEMIDGEELLPSSIVWSGDRDRNTVLHLAVMFKQVQTTSYLASLPSSAVNCLNSHGSTPLDCLELCPKDYKSVRIREILIEAGGGGGRAQSDVRLPSKEEEGEPPRRRRRNKARKCCKSMGRKLKNFLEYDTNWLEKMKETLLLVATIIASMSFQAATNPPGGVWSEDRKGSVAEGGILYEAGTAVLGYGDKSGGLDWFMSFNTVAFGSSLGIILLIVGGFPIRKNKLLTWILTLTTCVALTCMTLAFVLGGLLVIPGHIARSLKSIVFWAIFLGVWVVLILVIGLLDTLRLAIWVYGKLGRALG
ncbi:Ankyrin repeat-containing protein ITN1, partial [Linum grandiflorum]